MAETDPVGLVICDAGPLIHLEELGCLDLLRDFALVQVPEAVWQEVARHRLSALRHRKLKLQRVSPSLEATAELIKLAQTRLMQQSLGAILLTDDAAARLVAERLQYEVHGTIRVVLRALRRRQRTKRQVLNVLRSVPRRSSLFIERRLLASVIEQVEQA